MPKDIWRTIVAFANTDGGKIYFGVDDAGQAIGLSMAQADKIQKDIVALCNGGALSVTFQPEIKVIADNVVMVIINPVQTNLRPVYGLKQGVNLGTYVRVGSTNIRADGETIKRFAVAAKGGAEQILYQESYRQVFDLGKVKRYLDLLNEHNNDVYQEFSTEEVLIKQRALSRDKKQVTLFGLAAFSGVRDLQDIVAPTVNIAVTEYAGEDKVSATSLNETYLSNKEFNGDVVNQFTAALAFIKSKIPTKGIIGDSGQRIDKMVIPEIAIREALANAVTHRDYSVYSARIQVDIYQNRLEIINPGTSLIPIHDLDEAASLTRNPLLMNFLKEYGIVEQKGRGIRTIVSAIANDDLVNPKFENIADKLFKVTLFSMPVFTEEDKAFLATLKVETNKRQKRAIIYVRKHENGINNSEYRQLNHIQAVCDDKKANQELMSLVEKGILVASGEGKGRRYLLKK